MLVIEDDVYVFRIAAEQTFRLCEQHFHCSEFRQRPCRPVTSDPAGSGNDHASFDLRVERRSGIAEAFARYDQSVSPRRSRLPEASRTV